MQGPHASADGESTRRCKRKKEREREDALLFAHDHRASLGAPKILARSPRAPRLASAMIRAEEETEEAAREMIACFRS